MTAFASGEKPLWSHVVGDDVAAVSAKWTRFKTQGFNTAFVVIYAIWALWLLYRTSAQELGEMLKQLGPILIFGGLVLWAMKHLNVSQKIDQISRRSIFKSLVVTNRRLLFSNGHAPNMLDILASDIQSVTLDYHNGGRALKIVSSSLRQDILLIGIADLSEALHIIQAELMTDASSPDIALQS